MAEVEISVLTEKCLDRRMGSQVIVANEIGAWKSERNASSPNALLGGALLVEDIVGALAREGLTETKLTAGRERLWGRTTPCVPGSAGV